MPIYEYKCNDCGEKFEQLRSASDGSQVNCPNCRQGNTVKVFSAFASVGTSTNSSSCGCGKSSGFS